MHPFAIRVEAVVLLSCRPACRVPSEGMGVLTAKPYNLIDIQFYPLEIYKAYHLASLHSGHRQSASDMCDDCFLQRRLNSQAHPMQLDSP